MMTWNHIVANIFTSLLFGNDKVKCKYLLGQLKSICVLLNWKEERGKQAGLEVINDLLVFLISKPNIKIRSMHVGYL
jgi:hypothetical protein